MRREIQDSVTIQTGRDEQTITHPAFAQIGASRVSGSSAPSNNEASSGTSALIAGLGMTAEEASANASDAVLYRWLVQYLIGPRTDLDDAIVAAKTKDEYDAILDADMMAPNCIPNV